MFCWRSLSRESVLSERFRVFDGVGDGVLFLKLSAVNFVGGDDSDGAVAEETLVGGTLVAGPSRVAFSMAGWFCSSGGASSLHKRKSSRSEIVIWVFFFFQ